MLAAVVSALARCSLATLLRVMPSFFVSPPAVVSLSAMPGVVPSALVGLPVAAGALLAARVILIDLAEPLIVPGQAITPHTTASGLIASPVVLGLPVLLRFRLVPHAIVSAAFRRAGRVG
ncbi:hypothetical protein ACQP1V_05075 [Microtetraspora malaysiensis]|uniref:hypothetical protein n=1 Tax=Microtetraspora malaysiensis TaxID=161358 RepID=UPI003D93C3D1